MEDKINKMLCQQGKQICKEPCEHHSGRTYQEEIELEALIEKEEERWRTEYCDVCEETGCVCGT